MNRLILIASLVFAFPILAAGQTKDLCHMEIPCAIGERSYHLREPDGWDGQSALPVLLHFHGWMRQGDLVVKHDRIASATRKRGVLLVAPNGQRRTWDFWSSETPDVGFAAEVLADVARRYPVDPARIYVSGYSYGSAMAWRYVCENGRDVAALLAVAGTLRQNEDCPQAPKSVRHVHGLKDRVMDFPYGPGGETTYPVQLWRAAYACGVGEPRGQWQAVDWLVLERVIWEDCASGGPVVLDTHSGGHFIPHGWIARQLDELLDLEFSYP